VSEKHKIIVSQDGSHTIYLKELNETYHSTYGARQESEYVFIERGLNHVQKSDLQILEIGFGTGLNAWLTWLHRGNRSIYYCALEPFPLGDDVISKLNYADKATDEDRGVFNRIHSLPWSKPNTLSEKFFFEKSEVRLQDYKVANIDLVYFDAFGPDSQPEMWTYDIFNKIFEAMNPGGVLVTYCAKGQVRRDMQSVGFVMERLEGPPGKRHMLRGVKP
jgi:tRNA U34 5-methylaminomethyl-2-thiouridine-forming methyltransferase MnmC